MMPGYYIKRNKKSMGLLFARVNLFKALILTFTQLNF